MCRRQMLLATIAALVFAAINPFIVSCHAEQWDTKRSDEPGPGQVKISGYAQHHVRDGSWRALAGARVVLCDDDPELIWEREGANDDCFDYDHDIVNTEVLVNEWGFYSLPIYTLRPDNDDDGGQEDLYVRFEPTRRLLSSVGPLAVTDIWANVYSFNTPTQVDAPSGTYDSWNLSWSNADLNHEAWWLFDDMKRAAAWLASKGGDISLVYPHVGWEEGREKTFGCPGSCYIPIPNWSPSGVFVAHGSVSSPDVVLHELGHAYLHSRVGTINFYLDAPQYWDCRNHEVWQSYNEKCAFAEGWGHFLALVANESLIAGPDQCFDHRTWQPCTGWHDDLENQTWGVPTGAQHGHAVEGRVAGALYDIEDANIDGADTLGSGFADIWTLLGQNIYPDDPEDTARVLLQSLRAVAGAGVGARAEGHLLPEYAAPSPDLHARDAGRRRLHVGKLRTVAVTPTRSSPAACE